MFVSLTNVYKGFIHLFFFQGTLGRAETSHSQVTPHQNLRGAADKLIKEVRKIKHTAWWRGSIQNQDSLKVEYCCICSVLFCTSQPHCGKIFILLHKIHVGHIWYTVDTLSNITSY